METRLNTEKDGKEDKERIENGSEKKERKGSGDREKKQQGHVYYYGQADLLLKQADEWKTAENPNTNEHYLGLYSQAITSFTTALNSDNVEDDPQNYKTARSRAYRCRGEFMKMKGLNNQLIASDFIAAFSDNPECDKNQYNIASIYPTCDSNVIFKMECYNNAINKDHEVAKYYNGRGDVYKFKNEHGKAADDYIMALQSNPSCETTKSKKELFEVFKQLSESRQKQLYAACLDKNTVLGRRMWKSENILIPTISFFNQDPNEYEFVKCKADKGTLKAIREQYKKIDPDWVDPYAVKPSVEEKSEISSSNYFSFRSKEDV